MEYWNEYLTDDKIIFLFRLEDGFKRYEVKNYENDEDYNILYTELKNEEAILFLSESTERMDTLFNAIEGYD